jgi:hypothetical protein
MRRPPARAAIGVGGLLGGSWLAASCEVSATALNSYHLLRRE